MPFHILIRSNSNSCPNLWTKFAPTINCCWSSQFLLLFNLFIYNVFESIIYLLIFQICNCININDIWQNYGYFILVNSDDFHQVYLDQSNHLFLEIERNSSLWLLVIKKIFDYLYNVWYWLLLLLSTLILWEMHIRLFCSSKLIVCLFNIRVMLPV